MNTYEISKELLDGFIDALSTETMLSLYNDYSDDLLKKNTPKHRLPSFESFKVKDIRFVIFNKLVTTNYKTLFASLDQQEMAMLLGISNKEYNALYVIALKKLKINIFKNNRDFMEDSLDIIQELYYTSVESHDSLDNTSEDIYDIL